MHEKCYRFKFYLPLMFASAGFIFSSLFYFENLILIKKYLQLIIHKVTAMKMILVVTNNSSTSYSQQENLSSFACIHKKRTFVILKG